MDKLIGRKQKEVSQLKNVVSSRNSEFVAVYGRRQVGNYSLRSLKKQIQASFSAE